MKSQFLSWLIFSTILIFFTSNVTGQNFINAEKNYEYTAIAFDGDYVWFTTSESTIEKWNLRGEWQLTIPLNDDNETYFPTSIAVDNYHNKWIGTDQGLLKLNCDGLTWEIFNTSNSGIAFNSITHLLADDEGQIWCGSDHGISKYNGLTWFNSLNGKVIGIQESGFNEVWIAYTEGVFKVTGVTWKYYDLEDYIDLTHTSYDYVEIFSLSIDQLGNPVVSSNSQPGRYHREEDRFHFNCVDLISQVIVDENGKNWWTWGGGSLNFQESVYHVIHFENDDMVRDPRVFTFDKNGNIWMSNVTGFSIFLRKGIGAIYADDNCQKIEDEVTEGPIISPNPSNGFLKLNLPTSESLNSQITVVNSAGQIVYENTLLQNTKELNLSFLRSGVYFLKIQFGEWTHSEKVTVF